MNHVVFGTGPIGTSLANQLAASGEKVLAVNRSGKAATHSSVEVVAGDARDQGFTQSVVDGADIVYQCLGAPYAKWAELFPPLQRSVLSAARQASAKLVSFGNLYVYAPAGGAPVTQDLPLAATGKKGKLRADMDRELLAAHEAGDVRIAIGRASDFFGPRALITHMGERVFYPALAGKKAQVMGDPSQLHTFSYVPDVAAGLAALGRDDRADGRAWHLPNPPTLTTRDFVAKVYEAVGTEFGLAAMPKPLVNLVALFNSDVREIKEVLYQFEDPFVVDSSPFESTFGVTGTPLAEAIPATVDWFRTNPK